MNTSSQPQKNPLTRQWDFVDISYLLKKVWMFTCFSSFILTSCLIVHMPRRKRWRISKLWLVLVRSGNIVGHSNQYLKEEITEAKWMSGKQISRTNENVCLKVRFRHGTWTELTYCRSTLVNIFACENMRGLDICSCT